MDLPNLLTKLRVEDLQSIFSSNKEGLDINDFIELFQTHNALSSRVVLQDLFKQLDQSNCGRVTWEDVSGNLI